MPNPVVGIIMGSLSDWDTLKAASEILDEFSVPHECKIISAHRTPLDMVAYAQNARTAGMRVLIAGAGGAAHLPGMVASLTTLPVLGVPVPSVHLNGLDSLLSIVQMPKGIPVATFAIGNPGAANAALFAISILASTDPDMAGKLEDYRQGLVDLVHSMKLPENA